MKRTMTRFWKAPAGTANRGQVLAMTAVMMTALLAVTALSIDTGRLWMTRRALQNSVDAAALAGAWYLPDNTTEARAKACQFGPDSNAVPEMKGADCGGRADVEIKNWTSGSVTVTNGKIVVTSKRVVVPTLGSMFGWPSITIGAHATGVVLSRAELKCTFPLFQTQDRLNAAGAWVPDGNGNFIQFNVPMVMKTNSTGSNSGNFLFLQANGSSSGAAIRTAVGSPDGCGGGYVGDTATTATGNKVGPLDQGMEDRAAKYNNPSSAGYCPNPAPTLNSSGVPIHPNKGGIPLTPANCYRMIQFPLLAGTSTSYNGTKPGTIDGILTFYISNWCGQNSVPPKGSGSDSTHCAPPAGTGLPELDNGELWGYYLKVEEPVKPGDPVRAYTGLGDKSGGVALIE